MFSLSNDYNTRAVKLALSRTTLDYSAFWSKIEISGLTVEREAESSLFLDEDLDCFFLEDIQQSL